jgi:hypothetical protein
MATEIQSLMCNGSTDDAELVVLARVVTQMPELSDRNGLDCLLARTSEDIVTWSALDAWLAGADRLGMSDRLSTLASNARDDRTLRRLKEIQQKTGD